MQQAAALIVSQRVAKLPLPWQREASRIRRAQRADKRIRGVGTHTIYDRVVLLVNAFFFLPQMVHKRRCAGRPVLLPSKQRSRLLVTLR